MESIYRQSTRDMNFGKKVTIGRRGGAINTITLHNIISKNAPGMVVSGFLVEVERANLDELMKRYPEAFNRP